MLWYLLYPLRGTTEAPDLAPTHPLRKAFQRYGTWAARHVKIVLPVSGAVVFLFLYLFPFLYTTDAANVTSGVSYLPHHVWTDAQPLSEQTCVEPDVIMRSIWVHGSYMKALERDVLLGALELQDEILEPTTDFNPRQANGSRALLDSDADLDRQQRDAFHIINGLTDESWFFHSPLQYWSGSAEKIADDQDIVATVNEKKTQSTSVNTTLRHSMVFSGKRFEERKLVAADALVITLIHGRNSPVGRQWVRKTRELAQAAKHNTKWQIIPPDGKSSSDQLYEFQFRPLSWGDWMLLTLAYTLTISFLLVRLSKLRAIKSRAGLMVTIVAQIAASIVSSFSVCAIFKIDLSRIPYYGYPLVVLAISLENSFRLINAVIMTSSAISNCDRIGEAFGQTAHIAIANRVQNFLILIGLSRITYSGVSAFCTFAAIATLFDFFYLATFFLSVLSVDVRQRELCELEKASLKRSKTLPGGQLKQPWADGIYPIRLGDTTVSTRIAGTIVLIGFVLIAQAHFAPEYRRQWLNQIFNLRTARSAPKSSLLIDIHQARSPASWLRLQDHETAREVIKVVKPWAHSYVARVYDPVIFVLKGADRTPDTREPFFLPAVYDFLHREVPQFVVWLLTMLAALLLFTKHLVKDQLQDGPGPEHPDDEPILSARSLGKGHSMDIHMMVSSPGCHLVSIGIDREIHVWDVPSGTRSRVLCDRDVPLENPFPVLKAAVDDKGRFVGMVTWQRVFLWDIEKQKWIGTRDVDLGGQRPVDLFFVTRAPDAAPSLMLVRRDGVALEMQLDVEETRDFQICKTPLIWAVSFVEKCQPQQAPSISILTVSRKGCIHLVRQQGNDWVSTEVKLEGTPGAQGLHCVLPVPALSAYLIGRARTVDLVDLDSSTIIHTFQTQRMKPQTLKHIPLIRPQHPGLASLTLAYISADTGDLIIQSYAPEDETNIICSFTPGEAISTRWSPETKEVTQRIVKPGIWEALPSGSLVGVRRRPELQQPPRSAIPAFLEDLRRRAASALTPASTRRPRADSGIQWEAWVLNRPDAKADFETLLIEDTTSEDPALKPDHMMTANLGPLVKLGTMSVAVGFAEIVKVVSVGHEYFDRGGGARNGPMGSLRMGADCLQVVPSSVGARRKKAGSASVMGMGRGGVGGHAGPVTTRASI
ncbi:hypothetical protein VTI74DRAFT_9417 [Chaetomium olivicolor]